MSILKKTALAAVCVGTLVMAGGASAAQQVGLLVDAEVEGICEFAAQNYALHFGMLDPSSTQAATANTAITYRCTKGTAAAYVHVDGAPHNQPKVVNIYHAPGVSLPVSLTWTVPGTQGSGFGPGVTPISFPMYGTIAAADLNTAVAGMYGWAYSLTISP